MAVNATAKADKSQARFYDALISFIVGSFIVRRSGGR
jgi:hypothetical protein